METAWKAPACDDGNDGGGLIKGASERTKGMRKASVKRATKETNIALAVNLDGSGECAISTGIGFLDHMLEQLGRHGLIDLSIEAKGDLHIDQHHTAEDIGIALGQAIRQALGDRAGIVRFADVHLPMDEALTRAAIDISGRPYLVWKVAFSHAKIGDFDSELVREFFHALAQNAGVTLHIETLYGANNHHIAESCFKAVARALRAAVTLDPRQQDRIPSTKGSLTG
jgi:imidazoleglycerol-phosphate dehydratase